MALQTTSPRTSPGSTPPSPAPSPPTSSEPSATQPEPIEAKDYPHLSPRLLSRINSLILHPPSVRSKLATGVNQTIYLLKNLRPDQKREYLIAGLAGFGLRDPAAYLRYLRADAVTLPLDGPHPTEDIEDLILLICYDSALLYQPATIAALIIKSLVLTHATILLSSRAKST